MAAAGGLGGAAGDAGFGGALAGCSDVRRIEFGSNSDWTVYSGDPVLRPLATRLGPAQPVCLNPGAPTNCPAGAVDLGYSGGGWTADLSGIPGALWIWDSDFAPGDAGDFERVVFVGQFTLGAEPTGTLSIAADDYARVRVNGTNVGTIGSTTNGSAASQAQSELTAFDLTPALVQGVNTVVVVAQNGDFGSCAGVCSYRENPAGVAFGGVFAYCGTSQGE
jgi:hypothetical protein